MVDDPSDPNPAKLRTPPPPKLGATGAREHGARDDVDEDASTLATDLSAVIPDDLFDPAPISRVNAAKADPSALDQLFEIPTPNAPRARTPSPKTARRIAEAPAEDKLFGSDPPSPTETHEVRPLFDPTRLASSRRVDGGAAESSPSPSLRAEAKKKSDDANDALNLLLGVTSNDGAGPTQDDALTLSEPPSDTQDSEQKSASSPLRSSVGGSLIDALHASLGDETPSRAGPVAPRKGALPPPPSDGHRPRGYVRDREDAGSVSHPRSSASGLPRGVRPPGAPQEAAHEDTDVLIASAVELLTAGEPKVPPTVAPAATAVASPPVTEKVVASPLPDDVPPPAAKLPRWVLWTALAAVSVALTCAFWPSGERKTVSAAATQTQARDQGSASNAPEPEHPPESEHPPEPELRPEPELPPEPLVAEAALPDLGVLPVEDMETNDADDDASDTNGESEQFDGGDEVVAGTEPPSKAPQRASRRKKSSRKRKRKSGETETTPPSAAKPPAKQGNASDLLEDARQALRAGSNARAYSLAAKSRAAKYSAKALVVMATAACRMGDAVKAKRAFNQLSVGNRRGIRTECRNKGVRLGL